MYVYDGVYICVYVYASVCMCMMVCAYVYDGVCMCMMVCVCV